MLNHAWGDCLDAVLGSEERQGSLNSLDFARDFGSGPGRPAERLNFDCAGTPLRKVPALLRMTITSQVEG